jgi:hypothetical protein
MFKKLFANNGRGKQCYDEAVMGFWPQWEEHWSQMYPQIMERPDLPLLIQSTTYRHLMSEFWVCVIAEDSPWARFDIAGTFQAERVRRQEVSFAWAANIPDLVANGHMGTLPPAFAPVVVARRSMKDDEFLKFIAFEYIAHNVANVSLQQVIPWRQNSNDIAGWGVITNGWGFRPPRPGGDE